MITVSKSATWGRAKRKTTKVSTNDKAPLKAFAICLSLFMKGRLSRLTPSLMAYFIKCHPSYIRRLFLNLRIQKGFGYIILRNI
jgi:hypothetical protein